MAELGNTISNKIYEANVHEVIAARARSSSAGEVRENWIKAKYVAKAFIRDEIFDPEKATPIRKWTVRRLRRRARTSSLKRQSAKEKLAPASKGLLAEEEAALRLLPEPLFEGGKLFCILTLF